MLQSFVNNVPAAVAMFDKDLNHVSVSKDGNKSFTKKTRILLEKIYSVFTLMCRKKEKKFMKMH
jgi:hypothetical protein